MTQVRSTEDSKWLHKSRLSQSTTRLYNTKATEGDSKKGQLRLEATLRATRSQVRLKSCQVEAGSDYPETLAPKRCRNLK